MFNKPTCSCLSIDSHRYPYSFSLSAPTGLLVTGNWQMVTGNWLLPQLLGLLGTQRTTNVTVTLCAAIHVWKWVVLWVVHGWCCGWCGWDANCIRMSQLLGPHIRTHAPTLGRRFYCVIHISFAPDRGAKEAKVAKRTTSPWHVAFWFLSAAVSG